MSLNQNNENVTVNTKNSKVNSIARKLKLQFAGIRIRSFISFDLFFLVFYSIAIPIFFELQAAGNFVWDRDRDIIFNGSIYEAVYYVYEKTGATVLKLPLRNYAILFTVFISTIVFFQLIKLLSSIASDNNRVYELLKPLNDVALKTEELSRLATSEGLDFHAIENAIDSISSVEEETIDLHDDNLKGIEVAINNLLKRLRDSYRQQTRFVNDASHELRTPIAVIKGYVNMLERWGREDEKVLDESITAISHEAEHMNILVEQLLFLARGDSGKTVLKKEDISANDLMREIYEESFMIDEDHPYRFNDCDEKITVSADPTLLKQAIRILIDNAAKYTNAGDEIILSLGRNKDNRPMFMVEDTGIGMSNSDVSHMFERFYRSDEVRSYRGTGLGLSIAKWIVDRHGGHFEVLSREGLGTRIYLVL